MYILERNINILNCSKWLKNFFIIFFDERAATMNLQVIRYWVNTSSVYQLGNTY